jgi:hypothetical protein
MATAPGLRSRDGADPEEKSAGKCGRVAHGLNLSDRGVLVKLEAAKLNLQQVSVSRQYTAGESVCRNR